MDRLKEFFDACRQGNPGLVKNIIARGIDPHSKNDFALVLAANSGNTELLQLLVDEYGLDVNAWEGAALHHASAAGQMDSVRFLLEKVSDVESQDNRALRWAVLRGHAEMTRFLIAQGANRHVITTENLTIACSNGYLQLVMYLMEEIGLIPHNNAPLRYAVFEGHHEIVRYLVQKTKVDIRENDSYLLRYAAKVGNLQMLETLVDLGADAHAKEGEAFRSAVKEGHLDCVKCLVERGGVDDEIIVDMVSGGGLSGAIKWYLGDVFEKILAQMCTQSAAPQKRIVKAPRPITVPNSRLKSF